MILTYSKSIQNPYAQTMIVVPDHSTLMLKAYSDEGALLLAIYVDGEEIEDVLVAEGRAYDALFADLPDMDYPGDLDDEEEYEAALEEYYAAEEKHDRRKNEIFEVILKEFVWRIKDGDFLELDFIIRSCLAPLSKKYANQKS